MSTRKRVLQLMKEYGMNINNEMLVLDMMIFYTEAQQDLLKEQLDRKE